MAKQYRPSGPFTVPMTLQVPTVTKVKGSETKTYEKKNEAQIFGTFRTFGGTERVFNGKIVVDNTGTIETWYRPDITSDCRVIVGGSKYEILGTPEDVNMRHQFSILKVRAIEGGA